MEIALQPGPAVYVGNHLGSTGPLQIVRSIPVRFYPWVIGEMLDPHRAPDYLYADLIEKEWRLSEPAGRLASRLIAPLAVRALRSAGSIPVERSRGWTADAFQTSLELLAQAKSILIMPEDSGLPMDPTTHLHPFQCGFVALCGFYAERYDRPLPVRLLLVHPPTRRIVVQNAGEYPGSDRRRAVIEAYCHDLYNQIREMWTTAGLVDHDQRLSTVGFL